MEYNKEPKLIKTWSELAECTSNTHTLEIDVDMCYGWIKSKTINYSDKDYYKHNFYLSTHTFYGERHKHSTNILQECGFNVIIDNCDVESKDD